MCRAHMISIFRCLLRFLTQLRLRSRGALLESYAILHQQETNQLCQQGAKDKQKPALMYCLAYEHVKACQSSSESRYK
ncbi:hypothetical protein M758_5G110800 [Ceratodon purpureus]|nr:hypothetical protein M758_5G110800 [Ceratodon purpureus]